MAEPLSAVVQGNGPGVVLVHGAGGSARGSWSPVLEPLAERFTVVAPNNPGSADTPVPECPLELDEIADRVVSTATDAGLNTFAVIGQSLGTAISVRIATRHPERVSALALIAGFAKPHNTLRSSSTRGRDYYTATRRHWPASPPRSPGTRGTSTP